MKLAARQTAAVAADGGYERIVDKEKQLAHWLFLGPKNAELFTTDPREVLQELGGIEGAAAKFAAQKLKHLTASIDTATLRKV